MALSTGLKVAIGIAGAAAVVGVVAATRTPPKKKKKNGKGNGTNGTNGDSGTGDGTGPGTKGCPAGQILKGYTLEGEPICTTMGMATTPKPGPIPGDKEVMDKYPSGNAGYTSFFTKQSEQILRSDLQAWANANPDRDCDPVVIWDLDPSAGEGGVQYIDYFPASRHGTIEVLGNRYPSGGTGADIEWGGAADSTQQWIQWLFFRTERIANKEVCGFIPQ